MTMSTRKSTRFVGVQSRESTTKRFNNRPDVCFTIDYKDAITRKRIRKDIGWASDGITAAYASQVRADLITKSRVHSEKGEHFPTTAISLGEAFERYVNEWLLPRGKNARNDTIMFNHNLSEYSHINLSDISVYLLDTIIGKLSARNLSPRTIRYLIGLIQRVMRKMEAWGLYQGTMPFSKLTLPKLNNKRERFLTPEEATDLLENLREKSLTVYLQALLSLHCGMRFGEIAALRLCDLDFFGMNIYIQNPKNGKSRHQVMTEMVAFALKDYLELFEHKELIFPTIHGTVQKAVSKTFERTVSELGFNTINGIEIMDARQRVVFHTLRHTYASWLAMSGQGQAMIADLLGHSSLEMSHRYTHLFPNARRATADAIQDIMEKGKRENDTKKHR